MTLSNSQIAQLLNDARAAGLDTDSVQALEWALRDRAAHLTGAMRLDMALLLAPDAELRAADTFLVEARKLRQAALQRGRVVLNGMSDEEWKGLIGNG